MLVAAAAVLAVACAPAGRGGEAIEVSDAYLAEPVSGDVAAAYVTIRNRGTVPDTLVGARTPIAGMVHLHRMAGMGRTEMRVLDAAEVPAGGQLQLRPGSLHLMLMNLSLLPRAGDTVQVTLLLRRAGEIALRVPVVSYLEAGERAVVGAPGETR